MSARKEIEALLKRRGNVTSRSLRRSAERAGCVHVRTRGGHHMYRRAGDPPLVIPQSLNAKTGAAILHRLLGEIDEEGQL